MNKYQALQQFYSSFGLTAYEENTIKKDAEMPYITYEVITDSLSDTSTALSCTLWYKSNKWTDINAKAEAISSRLATGVRLEVDNGYIILDKGSPFAQNVPKSDDNTVKAKYININAQFITL